MCFKGEEPCFGKTCYMISETGKSWDENQKNCKASGGDLVSLETEAEWQFVNSKIQNITLQGANEWHIGLKKQGDWKWVNGNPMTIEKWQRSQPSGDGNVAVMSKDYPPGSQGLFNDLNAQMPRPFICEIPKGKLTATSSFGLFQRYCLRTYIYFMIIHFLCPPLCCLFLLFDYLTFRLPRSSQQLVSKGRYPSALEKSYFFFIQGLVLSLDLNQPQNLLWGQQKHQLHHRLQHLQQVPQQNRPVALLLSQLAEQRQVETFKTMFTIF